MTSSQARRLVVGTRGSPLALAQTTAVEAALRRVAPGVEIARRVVTTEGDRVQAGPLPSWGRGVFARDIETALLRGEVDLAVHSLKDLPADLPDGLAIVAVPRRGPVEDVLVSRDGLGFADLPAGARVGTSSLRRTAFLRAVRPDLAYLPVRGNVDTRWRKLLDPTQGYDALVLAAAGLERLGLDDVPRVAIPTQILLPAPGQGALAIEARAADAWVAALVAPIGHRASAVAVRAERRLLADLEGGCRLPVAALAQADEGGSVALTAAVAAPDGTRVLWQRGTGRVDAPDVLGAQVAAALLAAGARDLLRQAAGAEVLV